MFEWLQKWLEPEVLIQCLIFLGLVKYACETLKIRKASQKQNEIVHKPCLVPVGKERHEITDGLSRNADRLVGNTPQLTQLAFSRNHLVEVENVGYGTAFNVVLEIQKGTPASVSNRVNVAYIRHGDSVETDFVEQEFQSFDPTEDVKLKLSYTSLGGWRYENVMSIRQGHASETLVGEFQFDEEPPHTPKRKNIWRWI